MKRFTVCPASVIGIEYLYVNTHTRKLKPKPHEKDVSGVIKPVEVARLSMVSAVKGTAECVIGILISDKGIMLSFSASSRRGLAVPNIERYVKRAQRAIVIEVRIMLCSRAE